MNYFLRPQIVLPCISLLLYCMIFVPVLSTTGTVVAALSLVPVSLTGWLAGMTAGTVMALVVAGITAILFSLAGIDGVAELTQQWPGVMMSVVVGAAAGRIRGKMALLQRHNDNVNEEQLLLKQEVVRHRKTSADLRESEERFRMLFEFAPDGYYLADLAGRFIDGNREAERLVGCCREQLIGKSFLELDLLSPDQIPKAAKLLALNAMGTSTGPDEFHLRRKDGTRIPVDIRTVTVKIQGRIHILGMARDISYRKKIEQELRVRSAELSASVNALQTEIAVRKKAEESLRREMKTRIEAVQSLHEKERLLIQQNRMAAMGDMIANISHQWRQPLNVLGLHIQNLQVAAETEGITTDLVLTTVSRSMEVIQHMSRTIDDFREFFRPNREMTRFRISDTVRKTVAMLEGRLSSKGVRVTVNAMRDPEALGFPNEYAQVLINLLNNAVDVLLEREVIDPHITITVDTRGDRSAVSVADNGGGIAEEILGRIFDPYFTTKHQDRGTGLGLFMSKTIIEKNMNGHLTAGNSEHGAVFMICV